MSRIADARGLIQRAMKADHPLAMTAEATLLRHCVTHNGPLFKGIEARQQIWPSRPKLWPAAESIYPWLSRGAVEEWKALLA